MFEGFDLNVLEELRTKDEFKKYLMYLGINVSDEQIDDLKKQYKNIKVDNNKLTMDQLDNIAGGCLGRLLGFCFGHLYEGGTVKKYVSRFGFEKADYTKLIRGEDGKFKTFYAGILSTPNRNEIAIKDKGFWGHFFYRVMDISQMTDDFRVKLVNNLSEQVKEQGENTNMLHYDYATDSYSPSHIPYIGQHNIDELQHELARFPALSRNSSYQIGLSTDNLQTQQSIPNFAPGLLVTINEEYKSFRANSYNPLAFGKALYIDWLMRIKGSCTQQEFDNILQSLESNNPGITANIQDLYNNSPNIRNIPHDSGNQQPYTVNG